MPTTSNPSPAEELRSVQDALRDAVAAEDLPLALAMLPRLESALRHSLTNAADGAALWAEAHRDIQSCLHMVRAHRQGALEEYSRLFNASSFSAAEPAVGTWGISG